MNFENLTFSELKMHENYKISNATREANFTYFLMNQSAYESLKSHFKTVSKIEALGPKASIFLNVNILVIFNHITLLGV